MVLAAGSAAGENTAEDRADRATFEAICGSCHATSLVEGLRTEAEWRDEVAQMVKIGARGTDAQFQRVFRVLARTLSKVNVNTATSGEIAAALDLSDGAAEAIVKRRVEKGKLQKLDELLQIPGLDAHKLEQRKERILF